ncbi:MAG: deoxyribose-phosphate aldolase [Pirellulaceae bacterium]|nr:deoxyribose-phosphate aldolase [Pirellulaceae bacterium]
MSKDKPPGAVMIDPKIESLLGAVMAKIDHSVLGQTATEKEVYEGAQIALLRQVAAFCVKPSHVAFARKTLSSLFDLNQADPATKKPANKDGSEERIAPLELPAICTVVGFPHGANCTEIKLAETALALEQGATEIDMVVNLGDVHQGAWEAIGHEIASMTERVHQHERPFGSLPLLKVIFETTYLKDSQIRHLAEICADCQVDYVKTSTGFDYIRNQQTGRVEKPGATSRVVALMREICQGNPRIKASGGITTWKKVNQFLGAGADRIGTSATEAIYQQGLKVLGAR